MKKALLLSAVLLFGVCSFADTIVNNFTGYNDGYRWFGAQPGTTQTYGEVFTAPQGVSDLSSFSFYTGSPIDPGPIIAGALHRKMEWRPRYPTALRQRPVYLRQPGERDANLQHRAQRRDGHTRPAVHRVPEHKQLVSALVGFDLFLYRRP